MQLNTILNHVERHKGFVYEELRWFENGEGLEVLIRPRRNGRPLCSGCGQQGSTYDRLPARRFAFVPLWGIAVMLVYAMRRVDCPRCGVKVEQVPWAAGKSPVSRSLALYLADWAKVLSWQEVARRFKVNWHQVFTSVRYVVTWGLEHRDPSSVTAIGIDEIQFGKGHQYLTVVYQLCGEVRRLLYVGQRRDSEALLAFFDQMGAEWCGRIEHVCTDMWQAYLKVIRERLLNAVHVLDRFHIVKLLNEAVDTVRREEARELRKQGIDLLKGMRYAFLKRPENRTKHQEERLYALLGKPLRTVRAYLWKEKFQRLWTYDSPRWARWYLRKWCKGAMRSRLKPLKKFVKTMRKHEDLIMNWFEAKIPASHAVTAEDGVAHAVKQGTPKNA